MTTLIERLTERLAERQELLERLLAIDRELEDARALLGAHDYASKFPKPDAQTLEEAIANATRIDMQREVISGGPLVDTLQVVRSTPLVTDKLPPRPAIVVHEDPAPAEGMTPEVSTPEPVAAKPFTDPTAKTRLSRARVFTLVQNHQPVTLRELAELTNANEQAVYQLLAKLKAAGLVTRDKFKYSVRITEPDTPAPEPQIPREVTRNPAIVQRRCSRCFRTFPGRAGEPYCELCGPKVAEERAIRKGTHKPWQDSSSHSH